MRRNHHRQRKFSYSKAVVKNLQNKLRNRQRQHQLWISHHLKIQLLILPAPVSPVKQTLAPVQVTPPPKPAFFSSQRWFSCFIYNVLYSFPFYIQSELTKLNLVHSAEHCSRRRELCNETPSDGLWWPGFLSDVLHRI